ncbi:LOW QUALITY PROTEIN: cyclin-P3-1 [Primulina eburnea]|uniref:LOW QUALITY PROTEIN: cyclin-P3-1 n=1 Tax=Primulina eburnea TaxID=1245227 RepID=UPI003C6CAAD2
MMGALAFEKETVFSNDDAILGLKDSNKDNRGNPRVLSLLSMFLERSIQKNERILETTQVKDAITIFHGLRAPSLSIPQYIARIFKYSCCSPSCFVIAHIYVDRFIQRTDSRITSLNIHRLLITSVMVAAKFMDDAFFNNAYYARVGGVSTTEMNKLERRFLFAVDFRLYVSVQTFEKYCSALKIEVGGVGVIERPIQACGVKDSWGNKDDSSHSRSIAR